MAIILALLAGAGSFGNAVLYESAKSASVLQIGVQIILALASILTLFVYRGKRSTPAPGQPGVRWFTFGYCVCIFAMLASLLVLAAMLLGQK